MKQQHLGTQDSLRYGEKRHGFLSSFISFLAAALSLLYQLTFCFTKNENWDLAIWKKKTLELLRVSSIKMFSKKDSAIPLYS